MEQTALISQRIRDTIKTKHKKPMPNPYYFGNAISVDMLNLKNNECTTFTSDKTHPALKKDYSILSIGCGNLRNFIHTVASLPTDFQGKLHTTLNDYDPFMQARNLLFLYMIICFGDKCNIAGIVSTIWYSIHLSKEHYDFLVSCLRALVRSTEVDLSETTRGIINISAPDLNLLKKVWQKWLSLECDRRKRSNINLRKQRQELLGTESNVTRIVNEYKKEMDSKYLDSFEEWLRDGIFLGTSSDRAKYLKYGNPTLTGYMFFQYADVKGLNATPLLTEWFLHADIDSIFKFPERLDFVYCIPPDLLPFGTWDHLLVQQFSQSECLIDMYYNYVTDQIQQNVTALKTIKQSVSFVVSECREVDNAVSRRQKFDRIFTSNIADYIGTRNLLAAFKSYLNVDNKFATIVTQHWNWYLQHPKANLDNPFDSLDLLVRLMSVPGHQVFKRALLDTGKHTTSTDHHQEYFNSIGHFVDFLRADFAACQQQNTLSLVTFQEVKMSSGLGLRMRDFRQELNRIVPFQYRCNVRQVNMLRGQMSRMVEWYIP